MQDYVGSRNPRSDSLSARQYFIRPQFNKPKIQLPPEIHQSSKTHRHSQISTSALATAVELGTPANVLVGGKIVPIATPVLFFGPQCGVGSSMQSSAGEHTAAGVYLPFSQFMTAPTSAEV
jgi:hypothetical protein